MHIRRRSIAYEGRYLRIVHQSFTTGAGHEGIWETVERCNVHGGGAVVVVAVTRDRKLLLERNFRVPIASRIIQFPAGLTDKAGESEEDAARRELLEETGYRAGELVRIANVPLSPTLTATMAVHFLARDVEYAGPPSEGFEEIEVLPVPLDEVPNFLTHLPPHTMLDLRVPGILWLLEKEGLLP